MLQQILRQDEELKGAFVWIWCFGNKRSNTYSYLAVFTKGLMLNRCVSARDPPV